MNVFKSTDVAYVITNNVAIFSGSSSMITLAFWVLFTSNTPSTNRHISASEKDYIIGSLKGQVRSSDQAPKVNMR